MRLFSGWPTRYHERSAERSLNNVSSVATRITLKSRGRQWRLGPRLHPGWRSGTGPQSRRHSLGRGYVSGLFVSDDLGAIPGTLPICAIDLKGSAVTPIPSTVVNFRSFSTGCADPQTCEVEVADTELQQGQGMHGSFSRADTAIIGGAIGPDFRTEFLDPAPTSNADIGKTMARILSLAIPDVGKLIGRIVTEAIPNGAVPEWKSELQVSEPDAEGRVTQVATQSLGSIRYFDAAGYPGRTLGLSDQRAQ